MPALTTYRLLLGSAALAALAACAAGEEEIAVSHAPAADHAVHSGVARTEPVPGGAAMTGTSIATMADQYRPRAGATAATGASSWVPAAPAPAYVATGPGPQPDAPTPPPAAVANRQPSTPARPAVAASDIVRPEAQSESLAPELQAAAPAPAPAARPAVPATTVNLAEGRKLFSDFTCGACHRLADASATGAIGPSLDNNPRLTLAFTRDTIHDGRGAMPSFAGQISDPDIAKLAAYIVQVSRK